MPYRPPLIAREYFVADPPELPVREPGETGLAGVRRAGVVASDGEGVTFKGAPSADETLVVQVTVAGEGVIRVRLGAEADARSRAAQVTTMVTPGRYGDAVVEAGHSRVIVDAGSLRAEIRLDPWNMRFTDRAGRTLVEQDPGRPDISGRLRTLPFGRSSADGVPVAYHETFLAPADEAFGGFGESFTLVNK